MDLMHELTRIYNYYKGGARLTAKAHLRNIKPHHFPTGIKINLSIGVEGDAETWVMHTNRSIDYPEFFLPFILDAANALRQWEEAVKPPKPKKKPKQSFKLLKPKRLTYAAHG